jgi:hypothetical protein
MRHCVKLWLAAAGLSLVLGCSAPAKQEAASRGPLDHLQILCFGIDLAREEKPTGILVKPGEVPVSHLTEGRGTGHGFSGMSGGVACTVDNEGKWHCTPLPSREMLSGGYGLSRKDETTLDVSAHIKVGGKEHSTKGELVLEEGQMIVLPLPDGKQPRFLYFFVVTPTHAPKTEAEKPVRQKEKREP